MSKRYKIKWTNNDTKELNRVVRNFNAKINRLTKQNPQIKNLLPEKIAVRDLKELINTRQDLNRELKALRRFSKRGSEEIVSIKNTDYNIRMTKWQRSEMSRRVAVINRRRKKRLDAINNLEMTSGGKPLGYKVGEIGMGELSEVALKPMNAFTKGMRQSWVKDKWAAIMKESQLDYFSKSDEILRENIITAIQRNFNDLPIDDLVGKIKNMSIEKLLKIYQEEGNKFEDFYPGDESQKGAYLERLKETYK